MAESVGGSIEIIFGPMFSGKSTELLRKVKRYTIAQKKCLVISYAKDNRYSNDPVVSTHDR
jgi:thymidine kinase